MGIPKMCSIAKNDQELASKSGKEETGRALERNWGRRPILVNYEIGPKLSKSYKNALTEF